MRPLAPDITHWYLADGTRVEILDFFDDHARYLLEIRPAAAFTGPMVVTAMTELITRYGQPYSTLTDIQARWAAFEHVRRPAGRIDVVWHPSVVVA